MTLAIAQEGPPLRMDEAGVVRVGNTRVTLDTVVCAFQDGDSPEAIAEAYDTVCLADVYAVVGYYLHHRQEIDAYLAARRIHADGIRQQIQATPNYQLWRERLLARGKAAGLRP